MTDALTDALTDAVTIDYYIHWMGPFPYLRAFYQIPSGLFMVFSGQSVLMIDGAHRLSHQMGKHLEYRGGRVHPKSMAGRQLLQYVHNYGQRLTVKLGRIYQKPKQWIDDEKVIQDLKNALIFTQKPPIDLKSSWDGEVVIENTGKYWPLPQKIVLQP